MIPFPDLEGCTKFPYPEGIHFEFKSSFPAVDAKSNTKLTETVCAFLNTDGGYLIVGVQDDNRTFLGVPTNKTLDAFLLRCDNIYHSNNIVHEDGTPISPGTVTAMTVPVGDKILCVVKASPEAGQKYRLNTGEMYYRLSASNFRLLATSDIITMRVSEYHTAVFNKTRQIKEDYQKLVKYTVEVEKKFCEIQQTKEEMSDHYKELMMKYEKSYEKEKEATQILFDMILQQKKEKEEEIYGKKQIPKVAGGFPLAFRQPTSSKDSWEDVRAFCCLLS
jgi:predicted HTH transcriptional regulator